ncbi:MAG: hypothetical protein WD355_09940 [Balneolaceae bacterium]
MAEAVQFVDLTLFNSGARGYSGTIFDGRYLYLAPLSNGKGVFHGEVARYDSEGDIQQSSSWSFFDTSAVNNNSRGFVDGFFDGRYLYLVPYHHDRHHGQVTRYDTYEAFDDPGAWAFFDLQEHVHEACRGFVSGSFDGRYLYLSPYHLDWETHNGRMVRYDTQADFPNPESWQSIDSQDLWPESRGFHSAVSAGGYTWFIPYVRENRDYHGLIVRNRQAERFDDPVHWDAVDLAGFHPGACGYVGGCFDGRYLYLAPYYNGHERHGLAARLDTQKPFQENQSWEFFDTTVVDTDSRGFFGAIPDGDYIYFLPHCKEEGIYHGQFSRYDRRLSFDDPAAWSVFDTSAVHPKSMGFMGGVVISGHLVMAPYETAPFDHSGLVARLDLAESSVWRYEKLNDSSHVI